MDTGRTQLWGDVSQGLSYVQSATGNGGTQSYTGYGQVPAQTGAAPGSYSDTIVATATY